MVRPVEEQKCVYAARAETEIYQGRIYLGDVNTDIGTMRVDTGYPADSVEFCPHQCARNIFACGTYQLEETVTPPTASEGDFLVSQPQRRRGKCLVFEVKSTDD